MFQQVVINTLSFNESGNKHFYITDESNLGNPPVRLINYDLPGENFGLFVSALYGKRTFTLAGWVIGDDMSDFVSRRDQLYEALDILGGEQAITFTLANGRIVQINAVCSSLTFAPTAGDVTGSQFTAQFDASFPFLLTPTINQYSIGLPVGGGGTVPAPTMPMALGGSLGGKVTIVNNGNAPYWPKARIYGPVTNPSLLLVEQNLELQLTIVLTSGQYVDIDFKRKTIVDNFGTNQYSAKNGNWFYFMPGSNTIEFLAASYSSSALAEIFAQDSYLGL